MAQTLVDPTNEATPPTRTAAPRLESIDGRTIALLDISKARGDVFLDRVEERIADRGAAVIRFSKPTFSKVAPADIRAEIAQRCDAVIEALAD